MPPVETTSTPSSASPRREVDDPALVGDGQQGTADPDCSRLREWLPRPGGGVLGDARSIGEARSCQSALAREHRTLRRESAQETGAWSNAPRPTLSASSSAMATSSRSASSELDDRIDDARQEAKARREESDPGEDAAGDWEDTDDDAGGEDAEGFDDPEADEDEDEDED